MAENPIFPMLDLHSINAQDALKACKERGIILTSQERRKEVAIERLRIFQAQQPAVAANLYIDPETFSDTDPRFNSVEQLFERLTERGISIPVKKRNRTERNLYWAALDAWVHSIHNAPPSLDPPIPAAATVTTKYRRSKRAIQETATPAASVNQSTLADVDLFGEDMASTKQVDKSPTWETPLEDSTFSNSFEASFIALQDVYKHKANLADLIPMDASGLHVNNIIVYTPDPARSILFFYKVVGQCEAYIKVKRISTWPGEDDKINDSGKLAPSIPTFGLSSNSLAIFGRIFDSAGMRQVGCTLEIPRTVVACTLAQRSPEYDDEVVMTTKGSVPVNLFGDDMAGCGASPSSTQAKRKRVAFLPDEADISSSSSSSSSSSNISSIRSSSNKADGEWTEKLKEALTETKRAGAARDKTAAVHLTDAQAAVFSATPGELLNQGNQTALISLCYSYDKLEAEACPAAFWALKGPFRTQLQPAHLTAMLQSPASVDIRLFADLVEEYGAPGAESLMHTKTQSDSTTVDVSTPPDLSLIGKRYDRFRLMMQNFAFTIDTLLQLKPEIREALRDMLERLFLHCDRACLDPADPATPMLYMYWAHCFQTYVSTAYMRVKGNQMKTHEAVVAAFAKFPDTRNPAADFLKQELYIMHTRHFPAHFPYAPSSPATPQLQPKSQQISPLQPANLLVGKAGGPTLSKQKQICAFHISLSHDGKTNGCKQTNCTRDHRNYTTAVSQQQWLKKFLTRQNRTLNTALRS